MREAILRMTTTPQPCRPMAGAVAIPSADVEEIRPATPADTVVRQARSTRSWRSVEEWVTHTVDDGIGSGRKGCDRASGYTGDGEQKGRAVAVVSSKVASSKTLGRYAQIHYSNSNLKHSWYNWYLNSSRPNFLSQIHFLTILFAFLIQIQE